MEYLKLLEHSFLATNKFMHSDRAISKFEYLCQFVFKIDTYADDMDILFATKALEVCNAIEQTQTFDYIEDKANYVWYLGMCHLPFLVKKLNGVVLFVVRGGHMVKFLKLIVAVFGKMKIKLQMI